VAFCVCFLFSKTFTCVTLATEAKALCPLSPDCIVLVRKRKVLVLNDRFRPKRPENGLYQGHAARTSFGNSTSEAFRNPGSLPKALRTLIYKNTFYPFCTIWRLDSGVALSSAARARGPPRRAAAAAARRATPLSSESSSVLALPRRA
jgi:hypothetical protein